MNFQTENKLGYTIAIESSGTPSVYESEVIRLIGEHAYVVHGPDCRSGHADLCIVMPSVVGKASCFDEAVPTIILSDEKPMDLSSLSVVFPARTAPSSVAQVARSFLSGRRALDVDERGAAALESEARWIWSTVAETTASFEPMTAPCQWLRHAADLLHQEVTGLSVLLVAAKDEGSHWLLKEDGDNVLWQKAKTTDLNCARADELLAKITPRGFTVHLHERRSDFLIPFPGNDDMVGWILVAFRDSIAAALQRRLLVDVATYLQSIIKQRDGRAVHEVWRHAVESGLDSVESAIGILDKNDHPLLTNRAFRQIANHPSFPLTCRSFQFDHALRSARDGETVTVEAGELTFNVAPWGSLQNGCVLHASLGRTNAKGASQKLKDWFDRFASKAESLGLKLTSANELPLESMLMDAADPEVLATELSRPGFKLDVVISNPRGNPGCLLSFDQEGAEKQKAVNAVEGILEEACSVGRRLSIRLSPKS